MEEFRFDEQKTKSLRHQITEDIRSAIFSGKLKPGSRLRETDISKQMGVSRGPIREAMRMLEQEGLLLSQPYKETMVAEVTHEEVSEVLIPIRLIIEKFTLSRAFPLLDEHHYDQLQAILSAMREGAGQQDIYKMADCDLAFHEYLVNLSGLDSMMSVWMTIYNRIRLYFITQASGYTELTVLYQEHESLLQAIKTGDLVQASEALTAHINTVNYGMIQLKGDRP